MTSKCKTVTWTSVQLQNWHLQKPCSTLRRLQLLLTNGFQIDFKRLKLGTMQGFPNGFSYVQEMQKQTNTALQIPLKLFSKMASQSWTTDYTFQVILLSTGSGQQVNLERGKGEIHGQGNPYVSQKHSCRKQGISKGNVMSFSNRSSTPFSNLQASQFIWRLPSRNASGRIL